MLVTDKSSVKKRVNTHPPFLLHYFKVGQTTKQHFLELLWIPDVGPDPASGTRALFTKVPWEPVAFQTLIFVTKKKFSTRKQALCLLSLEEWELCLSRLCKTFASFILVPFVELRSHNEFHYSSMWEAKSAPSQFLR